MAEERNRTITYRLAEYFVKKQTLKTLEEYLVQAYKKLPNLEHRHFDMFDGFVLEGRHCKVDKHAGFFLHVVGYTKGERASIVPIKSKVSEADLDSTPPPKGTDFLDGDLMLLAKDNHVAICASNLHESRAQTLIGLMFEAADLDDDARKFALAKKANIKKTKLIASQGVHSISLDASLYDATLDHHKRSTIQRKISGRMWDEIKAIFADDKNLQDLDESENLIAHLVIRFDKRKRGGKLGRERLQNLGKKLVEDGEEGFKIKTFGGEWLSANDIVLRKTVSLRRDAKTVSYKQAWDALENYLGELSDQGLLEQ